MITAKFIPLWRNFDLPTITESSGVNIVTPLDIIAEVTLLKNETDIKINTVDVPFITSVIKDGISESFTITNNILKVAAKSTSAAQIQIYRSGNIDYSIYVGEIVPGISIDQGRLTGVVENIPSLSAKTYTFGLRGKWGKLTADVIKNWIAIPTDNIISWNPVTLPSPNYDPNLVVGKNFYSLGEFKRGQTIEVVLDVNNPDFTPLTASIRNVSEVVPDSKRFSGILPLGVTFANNPITFSGSIKASAKVGRYFFELLIDDPMAPPAIIFEMTILQDEFDNFAPISKIKWNSKSALGTINEGIPSTLKVSAENSSNTIKYQMAAGSRSLPIGLVLHEDGEIRGVVQSIDRTTKFTFSVKAVSSGKKISSKTFNFTVKNIFPKKGHLSIHLPISGNVRRSWETITTTIPENKIFRKNDVNFNASPKVLLVRGLNNREISNLSYDKPFDAILGPYKSKTVYADATTPVYDVIYREFYDPSFRAGGFVANNDRVIEDVVLYPQNPTIEIKEGTINNIRKDLVNKIGINSKSPDLLTTELLEPWMTSYVSAAVVANVEPETGDQLIQTLSYESLPVGTVVTFDRMIVDDGTSPYFHYLGTDFGGKAQSKNPLAPINFRVDGIDIASLTGKHPEPVLTWDSVQIDTTFRLTIKNATTTIRTVNLTGNVFKYTTAMQIADGNPGRATFSLVAVRDNLLSPAQSVNVSIKSGWGLSWGLSFGY